MHTPPLVGWLLVALCAAAGAYCLVRMRVAPRGTSRRAAGAEALMSWGMAVMALPPAAEGLASWAPVFVVVFGGAAVVALLTAGRRGGSAGHHLHHAVGASAMVYMALAMDADAMAGHAEHRMTTPGVPLLTGLLLVYFAVYVLRTAARLVPARAGARGDHTERADEEDWSWRPEVARACRLSMAIGMCAMLLAM